MCKISVIVPAYNAQAQIEKCIGSITEQTFAEWELLIIEDGSTDHTLEVCEKMAGRDARIRVLHQANKGAAAARNYGFREAKGSWIVFVDADDWIEPDCLNRAYDVAQEERADIVFWNMQHEFSDGRIQKAVPLYGEKRIFAGTECEKLVDMMLTEHTETGMSFLNMTGPCCKLIRASMLESLCFPEQLSSGEDACLVCQVLQKCDRVVYLSDIFYHRNMLENSLSNQWDADFWKRRLDYVNWVLAFFSEAKEKENALNYFCYENQKLVVMHYFARKNSFDYRRKRQAVEAFERQMATKIVYKNIRRGDIRYRLILRYRAYWMIWLARKAKDLLGG